MMTRNSTDHELFSGMLYIYLATVVWKQHESFLVDINTYVVL